MAGWGWEIGEPSPARGPTLVHVKLREALSAVLFVGCGSSGVSAGLALAGDATAARIVGALIGAGVGILVAALAFLAVDSWLGRRKQRDSRV
jgi:uncharacterized membrane protein